MKRTISRPIFYILIAFVAALSLTALLAYDTMRDLVASWNSTGSEAFSPIDRPSGGGGGDTGGLNFDPNAPIQPEGWPTPEPWDGNQRLTILVMGLDYRDWSDGNGLTRTDSMILLHIDPENGTGGILSVPRDMWVQVPDYGFTKLNTVYQIGEINRTPGGGPGLVMETIETLLGININFYAMIDFNTFIAMIDEIGGVKINVEEPILVDPLGDAPPKTIEPGVQTLPGQVALAYARARNTPGGDFDRAARQQQLILGIRDRILSFDMIPMLIARSPELYRDLADGIRTNMTLDQAVKLGLIAGQISPENIRRGVIGEQHVTVDWSPDGQYILIPIPDKIRLLRDEIFTPNAAAAPVSTIRSLNQLLEEEAARVTVLNGTTTAGLASRTMDFLVRQGIQVTRTGNADRLYPDTTIIDYSGKPNTLQFLIDELNINPARVFHSYNPQSSVDIEIILGDDWVVSGDLP